MPLSSNTDEGGWITVNELTVNGCEEVSESGDQSTLPESLAGSLAAAASPGLLGSESGHSVNSSPTTSEANSIPIGYIHGVDVHPSIDKLPLKIFETMAARQILTEDANYITAANPANHNSQPRTSRAALPRTHPDILNATCLVDLFPNMAQQPSSKVAEWIEACKRSVDESYEAKEASTPPSPKVNDPRNENENQNDQQQHPATDNTAGSRQQSEDPGSDSEPPEDPRTP